MLLKAPVAVAPQDGSLATNQPGTATPQALGTVLVVGADTAQCLTVVILASALTALTAWKVGRPVYLFCTVCFLQMGSTSRFLSLKPNMSVVKLTNRFWDTFQLSTFQIITSDCRWCFTWSDSTTAQLHHVQPNKKPNWKLVWCSLNTLEIRGLYTTYTKLLQQPHEWHNKLCFSLCMYFR